MGSGGKGTAGPSTAAREAAFYTWLVGETGPLAPGAERREAGSLSVLTGSAQKGAEGCFYGGKKCRSPFRLKQGVLSAASCMLVHPRTERISSLRGRPTAGTEPII